MTIRVLIVGDIRLYREGLERVLRKVERIVVVGTTSGREEAGERVQALNPDVILLDMAMSEAHTAVREITHIAPDVKVVALTVPEIDREVIACAEAGVAGYVTREGSVNDVIQSIEAAAKGELHCSGRIAASLLRRVTTLAAEGHAAGPVECLTGRESHILELVEQGLSNKEIARALCIEVATVKNHVHNILEKLGVHRRGEAAAMTRRLRTHHPQESM
ncbi:MAG: LuxR C-terminal-related transcriptional regulator [Acidiferrobacterales bacterium]